MAIMLEPILHTHMKVTGRNNSIADDFLQMLKSNQEK